MKALITNSATTATTWLPRGPIGLVVLLMVVFGLAWVLNDGMPVQMNAVPAFDWRIALDERHSFTISNGRTCLPNVPDLACEYVSGITRQEFRVIYHGPHEDRELVSIIMR